MEKPASWTVACLQSSAGNCWRTNLKNLRKLLMRALDPKPHLIVLAEGFAWRGSDRRLLHEATAFSGPVIQELKNWARKYGVAMLAGGLPVPIPHRKQVANTAFFISAAGEILASYDKIHLFQVRLKKLRFNEERLVRAGSKPVVACYQNIRIGLSICYDLRFPEHYRSLVREGAQILTVPSNFTDQTGRAHWETLLRARAIENQSFILAPCQSGENPYTGIQSHGHSMIIDPWGRILAKASYEKNRVLRASLDFKAQNLLRRDFPVLKSRKR